MGLGNVPRESIAITELIVGNGTHECIVIRGLGTGLQDLLTSYSRSTICKGLGRVITSWD